MSIPVLSPIDMGSQKITSLQDPTTAQDAATKNYVDTRPQTAGITIGNANAVPGLGSKGFLQIPYNATIVSWTIIADQAGSVQITVKKCSSGAFPATASIVAAAPPNLSAQQFATSATLTGWTTAISAGDILEFNLDSASACTRITLELKLQRT